MGSDTQVIEVRGCVLIGVKVGGGIIYNLVYCTGDRREMVSLHCTNILHMSVIASNWVLQVLVDTSSIAHARMDMAWMMRSSGVREGCVR